MHQATSSVRGTNESARDIGKERNLETLVQKTNGKVAFRKWRCRRKNDISMNRSGADSSVSGRRILASSCEQNYELSGLMKGGKFLTSFSNGSKGLIS